MTFRVGWVTHLNVREKRPSVGYFLLGVRLLKTRATRSSMAAPVKTGDNTNQYSIAFIFSDPITASSAVAPPGGCKVLLICIAMMDSATANGAVNQITGGQSLHMVTPTRADITCPPIRLRGCAIGLCILPYINTEDAPKDPMRNRLSVSVS